MRSMNQLWIIIKKKPWLLYILLPHGTDVLGKLYYYSRHIPVSHKVILLINPSYSDPDISTIIMFNYWGQFYKQMKISLHYSSICKYDYHPQDKQTSVINVYYTTCYLNCDYNVCVFPIAIKAWTSIYSSLFEKWKSLRPDLSPCKIIRLYFSMLSQM